MERTRVINGISIPTRATDKQANQIAVDPFVYETPTSSWGWLTQPCPFSPASNCKLPSCCFLQFPTLWTRSVIQLSK